MRGLIMIMLITCSMMLTLSFTENYSNNVVYCVDKIFYVLEYFILALG